MARVDHEDVPPLSSSGQTGRFIKWKRAKRYTALLHEAGYLLLGLVSLATVTGLYFWLNVALVTAAFTYLLVLVLLSLVGSLSSLIVLSFIGVCFLNYFFAPPIYSFHIDYPQDLITVSAFLITSFVVNFLVTRARVERRNHMRALEALRVSEGSARSALDGMRESEARLAEAQRGLRQLVDTIPILLVCYSTDARRDFVNAAWKEYTGLSDEAALGADWSIVAHPDDLAIGEKMWRDTLAKGEPVHTEVRLRRADGQYRWFAVDRVALRDESGQVIKWYGTAYDIEQRKRAEQSLRESEAKFRDFAETASDWFCEMGPDYRFTLLSENAFGSGAADRIGTACWDHALDLETEPEKWRLLQETVFSHKPFRDFVYRGMSGDGSPMYVRASGKPMFDANGEFHGYRGTCTDVTEIMHAQETLRESERSARSAIDGIASHCDPGPER